MANGKTKRGMSPGVIAWRKSAAWRRIASAQALANLRAFAKRPRCGAKAKSTGCPCRNPALANGRCRLHGGATPSGSGQWHTPVFSAGTTSSGTSRLDRKLYDLAQARKRRLKLLAAMTPEQREAHRRWHHAHDPSLSVRLSRRQAKAQALAAKAILAGISDPSPDIMRIDEKIRRLELDAKALARAAAAFGSHEGIFG